MSLANTCIYAFVSENTQLAVGEIGVPVFSEESIRILFGNGYRIMELSLVC